MKKIMLLIFILIIGVIFICFMNSKVIKTNKILVNDCDTCKYEINNHKVKIKNDNVYIENKKYKDVQKIESINGILLLTKEKGIIGYNKKELFNYKDGFDTSYPGMKIDFIKVDKEKMVIETTRLIDSNTIDIGIKIPVCVDGDLNYNELNKQKIDVNEPVIITYEANYDDYKMIAKDKVNVADYFKKVENCKTS